MSPTRRRPRRALPPVRMLPGADGKRSRLRAQRGKDNRLSALRLLSKALHRRLRGGYSPPLPPQEVAPKLGPPAGPPRCPEAVGCSGATRARGAEKRVAWRCKQGEGTEREPLGGRERESKPQTQPYWGKKKPT